MICGSIVCMVLNFLIYGTILVLICATNKNKQKIVRYDYTK